MSEILFARLDEVLSTSSDNTGKTFTGGTFLNLNSVTITPTPSSFVKALNTLQTGPDTTAVITGPVVYNNFFVSHRAHVTATALSFDSSGNWNDSAYGYRFGMNIGGANASGQFVTTAAFQLIETTPYTGASAYFDRVGALGEVYSTVVNPLDWGGMYAFDGAALLDGSGRSDQVVGYGGDVGVANTATARHRIGIRANSNIVPSGVLTKQASDVDAAFSVTNGSNDSSAFKYVIALQGAPFPGDPIHTNGSWFWAQEAWTVTNFADLGNMTFTGKVFNFQHATMDGPTGAFALGNVTSSVPTAGTMLTINNGTTALPLATGAIVQIADVVTAPTTIFLDTFGTFVGSQYIGRLARGTSAAPSAVQSEDILAVFGGNGYAASGYSLANAQIRLVANQTFTGSAQGTRLDFLVTPNGSTGASIANAMSLTSSLLTVKAGVKINNTGSTLPSPTSFVHIADAVNSPTAVTFDTFTNTVIGAQLTLRMARGTPTALTAVQAGDLLGIVAASGYGTSAYSLSNGQIRFMANQTFTDAAQGTRIDFLVTPNGSTGASVLTAGSFENDGGLTWPRTVTGGSKGVGTINATSLYQANVQVATLSGSEALTNKTVNKVTFTAPATSATLTIADGTTLTTTTSTSIGQGQYLGTATNDSATAGNIGEYLSSTVLQASAISFVTTVPKTVTSLSLTAGDWDVFSEIFFLLDTTTTVTALQAAISTADNTNNTTAGFYSVQNYPTGTVLGLTNNSVRSGPVRVSINTPTTYYLVGTPAFGTSFAKGWGILAARRVR